MSPALGGVHHSRSRALIAADPWYAPTLPADPTFPLSRPERAVSGWDVEQGGGMFGCGIYFATDQDTSDMYHDRWGGLSYQVTIRPRKPLLIDACDLSEAGYPCEECGHMRSYAAAIEQQHPAIFRRYAEASPFGGSGRSLSTYGSFNAKLHEDFGYDAVVVTEHHAPTWGPGGNQVVVLDPSIISTAGRHVCTERGVWYEDDDPRSHCRAALELFSPC